MLESWSRYETRITPAYAGKRNPVYAGIIRWGDHPRLCGEKISMIEDVLGCVGSPPPMRGKEVDGNQRSLAYRITPAYAGKSGIPWLNLCCVRDHPRLCGEKPDWDGLDKTAQGSPPPMRGKGQPNTRSSVTSGITPAYAGKSRKFSRPVWVTGDHPRLCGEKFYKSGNVCGAWGSPPPMRGKAQARPQQADTSQDHPRLCGEKVVSDYDGNGVTGSPPPMRGKVFLELVQVTFDRITPAYAGKRYDGKWMTNYE